MPTLNELPEFPIKENRAVEVFNTLRSSGRALRRQKNQRQQREFDLVFKHLTSCMFDNLKTLINSIKSSGSMLWTPPGEVISIEVTLADESFSFRWVSGTRREVSLRLRQVVVVN